MDTRIPLFSIKVEGKDGAFSPVEHPTDGEVIYTSKDNNIRSKIHIIPRREPDSTIVYMRMEVMGNEPFPLSITKPTGEEVFGMSAVLSGSSFVAYDDGAVWRYDKGRLTVTATHTRDVASWKVNPGEKHEAIAFIFSREERLATFRDIPLPPELAGLSGEHIDTRIYWQIPTPPPFVRIAREAIANPYRGAAKQFFLESKALEMLSELATLLDQHGSAREDSLTEADRWRLRDVRDTLLARYANPPSLLELAAESGMNHKKLNHAFRREFGVTMHGFLRDYRLEQGQKMIGEGRSVKETAFILGYRHPSAFINAYRKKFGAPPGAYGKDTGK